MTVTGSAHGIASSGSSNAIDMFGAFQIDIGRRGGAQIHDDVEDGAVRAADELRLLGAAPDVHAAHHAANRARLAVLRAGRAAVIPARRAPCAMRGSLH